MPLSAVRESVPFTLRFPADKDAETFAELSATRQIIGDILLQTGATREQIGMQLPVFAEHPPSVGKVRKFVDIQEREQIRELL